MSADYTVNGRGYSMMSPVNERILRKFIGHEFYCDMTQEVDYILRSTLQTGNYSDAPFSIEDYDEAVDNAYEKVCEDCGAVDDFEEYDPMTADESDFHGEDWNPEHPVYTCPICGIDHDTLQEARECCQYDDAYKCKNCGKVYGENDFDKLDTTTPEVLEWYAVSDWIGTKLGQRGEVVIDTWGKSYWGRQGTGQSIILDGVIQQIAYDEEILEGQKYSWEDKIA